MSDRSIKQVSFAFDATGAAQTMQCSVCHKYSTNFFWINGVGYCWEHVPPHVNTEGYQVSGLTAELEAARVEASDLAGRLRDVMAELDKAIAEIKFQVKRNDKEHAALKHVISDKVYADAQVAALTIERDEARERCNMRLKERTAAEQQARAQRDALETTAELLDNLRERFSIACVDGKTRFIGGTEVQNMIRNQRVVIAAALAALAQAGETGAGK